MKNQFEQHIKKSLEGFEADYNPSDWSDMQNKLSKTKLGKANSIGKGLMIAASIAVVAGLAYYFINTEKETTPVNPVVEQQGNTASENTVQFNGASSENAEINNTQITSATNTKNQSVTNYDSKEEIPKENIGGNQEPVVEQVVSINKTDIPENGTKTIEQPKEQVVAELLPVQPSTAQFSASFHSDGSNNKVCEGQEVHFVPDNKDVSCTYKWSFGDGGSSSEQSPSHVFSEAGNYIVKLHIASVKERKQADQKNTVTVVAAPSVQVNYIISEDNNLLVNFEADADKVTEWKWSFGDKQTASVQNPSHVYSKKGVYKAEVTAKNAAGCSTLITKEVNLKSNLNLLAPNAFSPDGNGINDTWMPVALLNGDYIFMLTIYDKAGNVVFKTSDKSHPWEGQNTNKGDTFIWKAIVKDKNGDDVPCQGLITVSE